MTRYNVGDRVIINLASTIGERIDRKFAFDINSEVACDAIVVLDKLDSSVLVVAFGETFIINRSDIIGYAEIMK